MTAERQPGTIIFEPGIIENLHSINPGDLPSGYEGTLLDLKLPNGQVVEEVAYGYRSERVSRQDDFNKKADSVLEAFIWILTADAFQNGVPDDNDRAEAITQVMGASIANGLTEDEVLHIYRHAYTHSKLVYEKLNQS